MNHLNVYVTDWGTHFIPDDIYAKAQALSPGKKLDRRTRGEKHLRRWAREQDEKLIQEAPKPN